jgi:hypothetical protein
MLKNARRLLGTALAVIVAAACFTVAGHVLWPSSPRAVAQSNWDCPAGPNKIQGYCANLEGFVVFSDSGSYEASSALILSNSITRTDRLRLKVDCRPDSKLHTSNCEPGTKATIRWSAKPGVSIAWFGAFPDAPRHLSGSVGHYSFVIGTLRNFEVIGDDLKETRAAGYIGDHGNNSQYSLAPATNPTVIGPPTYPFGQALINETGLHRASHPDPYAACSKANAYLDVTYDANGREHIFATSSGGGRLSAAYMRQGQDGTSAIVAETAVGTSRGYTLAWKYSPGVRPLGLIVTGWNGDETVYASFPSHLTVKNASQAPVSHITVCVSDPSRSS